jgi:neuronal guanine nucleotide exchange factor
MFLNEPLYQLYTAAKLESISSSEFEPEIESDGYEEISKKDIQDIVDKKPCRPSALQLIEPNQGPSRTLWSEVPEVIQSGIFGEFELKLSKFRSFEPLNFRKTKSK